MRVADPVERSLPRLASSDRLAFFFGVCISLSNFAAFPSSLVTDLVLRSGAVGASGTVVSSEEECEVVEGSGRDSVRLRTNRRGSSTASMNMPLRFFDLGGDTSSLDSVEACNTSGLARSALIGLGTMGSSSEGGNSRLSCNTFINLDFFAPLVSP